MHAYRLGLLCRPLAVLLALAGCTTSQQAPRIQRPVIVDGSGIIPINSDLGWEVTLTTCRFALTNLVFTTAGEFHDNGVTSLGDRLRRLVIADAWAHPGHAAGGEVIGELPGRFIVDWCQGDGKKLGDADLTVGDYNGANFEFTRAVAEDGLDAADPLVGHTIELGGTAVLGDQTITFHALLDQDEGRQIIGLPFDLDVDESSTETLGLQLLPQSPFSVDDLFDQLDFAAADPDGDGVVEFIVGDEGHTRLVRSTQSHDYYFVQPHE
ncbi:MAG: hypothetical protein R3B09_15390 [Nannocystaceae bacterium]